MKNTATYQIIVEASTNNLSKVRKFVSKHANAEGFSTQSVSDLCLAVDEAYTNIIKHAYKNDSSKTVEIDLEIDNEKICVSLKDNGESFKQTEYSLPDIREHIKKKKRGGMGVYLIHKLMDDVNYITDSNQNEIRLCKNRD